MKSMMEYNGYHASVEYDADANIFIGEVFGITDSLNFHGSSVDELRTMFEQSIDNYLELCQKIGKEPDKEFKGTFNIRTSPDTHRKAALAAAKQGITLNQYVSNAIEASFNKKETTEKIIVYTPYPSKTVSWNTQHNKDSEILFSSMKGATTVRREELSYGKH